MGLYDKVTWIAEGFLLLTAFTIVVYAIMGGLLDLDTSVDNSQDEEYRQTIILENVLSLKPSEGELSEISSAYRYEKKRAVLPAEYFTNEDPEDGEIGFSRNNGHCYISDVPSLDGEEYAFFVRQPLSTDADITCDSVPDTSDSVRSEVLLVGEDSKVPARIYIYPVEGSGPNAPSSSSDGSLPAGGNVPGGDGVAP